ANQVGVFRVKLVHQPVRRRGLVLRDFLDEGFVVQPMNLLELPIFVGGLKRQRLACAHKDLSVSAGRCRRSTRWEISSAIFFRCAKRTRPLIIVINTTWMRSCPRKSATSGRQTSAKRPGSTVRHCNTNAPKNNMQ